MSRSQSSRNETVQCDDLSDDARNCHSHFPTPTTFVPNTTGLSPDGLQRDHASRELPSIPIANHTPAIEHQLNQFEQESDRTPAKTHLHPKPVSWDVTAVVVAKSAAINNNSAEEDPQWPQSASTATDDTHRALQAEGSVRSWSLCSLTDSGILGVTRQQDIWLLSHFRYHLAPWLDVNDSTAFFAIKLLLTAQDSPLLMAAILRMAAVHKSVMSQPDSNRHDPSHQYQCMPEFHFLLSQEPLPVQRICRLLLKIGELFGLPVRQWREVVSEVDECSNMTLIETEEESSFLWYLRIGKHAS